MPQCQFSIPYQATAEEVAEKASVAIQGAGGSFSGNAVSGSFTVPTPLGTVKGTYVIKHPVIHVTITSKPFFVGCTLIEQKLKGYLEGGSGTSVS